jgi:glycine cleavage system H protein
MATPEGLLYSKTHEWVRVLGDVAEIGITDHAQGELGDVVYLDLPEVGRLLAYDDIFGAVESVKAVSDLYSPLSGDVIEVNTEAASATDLVNSDPYGQGWMVRLRMTRPEELQQLLTAEQYAAFAAESAH